jgi:hypothetical protein
MGPDNQAIVLNISDEGLGFHALNPVTQSGTVRFSFSDNSERIEASGELVWTDSTKKTGGLRFASLPQASRRRIWNWVDQVPTVASSGVAEPAPPRSGVDPPEPNAAPGLYFPLTGGPSLQPAGPGFVLIDDDPQGTRYTWDQEMSLADSRTKYFRGFVTGAVLSTILTAILFSTYGNPAGLLLAKWREMIGAIPPPQVPPSPQPPAAVPPPVSSALPPSGSIEAPAATPPIAGSTDDTKPNGAEAQTVTPPPADDHVTRAPETLPPKVADSGEAELVLAEGYLHGKAGPPDSAAAARFLWSAVRKGNVSAEIALADLYARGDGVTKSCDQAKVLLRAAAEKGSNAASRQLVEIIRTGCR